MKTIFLNVPQRMRLANQILPSEAGSFKQAKAVRKLRTRLELSTRERELAGTREVNGREYLEEPSKVDDKQLELSDTEVEVICWGFDRLEEDGTVPTDEQFFILYEMFEDEIEEVTS